MKFEHQKNPVENAFVTFTHYCVKRAASDSFFEETICDVLEAYPGAIYQHVEPNSGRVLLHNVFADEGCLPSLQLVRKLAGSSFLFVIQDHTGSVPLHYACAVKDPTSKKHNLFEIIEFMSEGFYVQNKKEEYPLDVYRKTCESGFGKEEVLFLLESKFKAPPTPLITPEKGYSLRDDSCGKQIVKFEDVSWSVDTSPTYTFSESDDNHSLAKNSPLEEIDVDNMQSKNSPKMSGEDDIVSVDHVSVESNKIVPNRHNCPPNIDKSFWMEWINMKSIISQKDDINRSLRERLIHAENDCVKLKGVVSECMTKIHCQEEALAIEVELRQDLLQEYETKLLENDTDNFSHDDPKSDLYLVEQLLLSKEKDLEQSHKDANLLEQKLCTEKNINMTLQKIIDDQTDQLNDLRLRACQLENDIIDERQQHGVTRKVLRDSSSPSLHERNRTLQKVIDEQSRQLESLYSKVNKIEIDLHEEKRKHFMTRSALEGDDALKEQARSQVLCESQARLRNSLNKLKKASEPPLTSSLFCSIFGF